MKRIISLFLLVSLLATLSPLAAQSTDPNAQIEWPPPVYALSGHFSVYGTANASGQTSYYLEFRPLIDAVTPAGDEVHWIPATLPARNPVTNGVLGVWDTTQIPDGVYELRLTIFTTSGQPAYARVSPLRVLNNPPSFVATPEAAAFPTSLPLPTLIPGATSPAANSGAPEAVALLNANVRSGDSIVFAAVGALISGQRAPIIAVSPITGWWEVQLPDGRAGWVAPSVVQVSGDLTSVPQITPPRPTATPTPIPTATPSLPDATIVNVRFDRNLKQGEAFKVIVTVANNSGVALPRMSVACNFTPMNRFFNRYLNHLDPFKQFEVVIDAQLDSGGGTVVTANCAVDVNNEVAETNESNNFFNVTTVLQNP